MSRALLVLAWPAGVAVIVTVGWYLTRRLEKTPPFSPAGPKSALFSETQGWARFLVTVLLGAAVAGGVMMGAGLLAKHFGPPVDKPVQAWIATHQVHHWASLMIRATKVGDTWTVRGAAVAAAICLAASWQRVRWLPLLALGILIVLQHPLTSAIHHVVKRVGPPAHLHGVFPSGGCERCIVFYGLIGYLLWAEFSRTKRGAILTSCAVAFLAFNEAYSRMYLGMHWLTDALGGLLYGSLLLAVLIYAARAVLKPFQAGHPLVPLSVVPPADPPADPVEWRKGESVSPWPERA